MTIRYRRPAGSTPPLTDAVGHLLAAHPMVRVRTKTGTVVEFDPADAVALRVLTDTPVRTAQIRGLEHAAVAAWPGTERAWLDGWLLRASPGATCETNSAAPLDISANTATLPAIADWYLRRDLTACLAIPDRVLRPPAGLVSHHTERVLVREVSSVALAPPDPGVTLEPQPSPAWLRLHRPTTPVDALTAISAGELAFGTAETATARAAVTSAPDGTRWVGLSAMRGTPSQRDRLDKALLAWGASHGATRGYIRAHDAETGAAAEAWGFRLHHYNRYFPLPLPHQATR